MNEYEKTIGIERHSPARLTALVLTGAGLLIPLAGALALPSYAMGFLAAMLICLPVAAVLFSVDARAQRRRKQAQLSDLLTQVRGENRRGRLLAIEQLRAYGWLKDGSLRGVDLSGLDLQGTNFSGADLRGVNLAGSNLRGADLHWADLTEADLSGVSFKGANMLWANLLAARGISDRQLAEAYILRRATMPDGTWYDGRYNLNGDIDDAGRDRVKTDDALSMSRWYEVPVDTYRNGQQWAVRNLPPEQPPHR